MGSYVFRAAPPAAERNDTSTQTSNGTDEDSTDGVERPVEGDERVVVGQETKKDDVNRFETKTTRLREKKRKEDEIRREVQQKKQQAISTWPREKPKEDEEKIAEDLKRQETKTSRLREQKLRDDEEKKDAEKRRKEQEAIEKSRATKSRGVQPRPGDISPVNGSDWKAYHKDLSSKMAVERLREALRTQDEQRIRACVNACNKEDLQQDHPEMMKAADRLKFLRAKRELEQARESQDADVITSKMAEIRDSGQQKALLEDLRETEHELDRLTRVNRLNRSILTMDKRTMAEIRGYPNPPPVAHHVMQAALLLLGHHEGETQEWRECQKLCNPNGQTGLNRRVMALDVEEVHPEIASRSREILQHYELKDAQTVSAGLGTFYVWAMGVTEVVDGMDKAGPASIERQRHLLGVQSPLPAGKRYWAQVSNGSSTAGSENGYIVKR